MRIVPTPAVLSRACVFFCVTLTAPLQMSAQSTMTQRFIHLLQSIAVPLLCTLAALLLLLADPMPMRGLRNALFDQYQRWQPRTYMDAPVRIVDIDDESLAHLGQWPWPRTRIAELVQRLRNAGVAVIGFDVVFAEPDRTSPSAMAGLWGLQGALSDSIQQLPDHDTVLAAEIGQGGVVLGRALHRGKDAGSKANPTNTGFDAKPLVDPYRFVSAGPLTPGWLHSFEAQVSSLPQLVQQAAGLGALTFAPDGDGVVRRVPLVLELDGKPVPSLASEALRVAQGAQNYILKTAPAQGTGLQEIRIGNVTVPTTAQGEVWVHYTESVAARYVPAWKVLAGEVDAKELDGKLVLVGTSAQGLMDLRSSPLGRIMPGVEAHAQAIEQILTGGLLARPSWANALEAIVLSLGSLLIGVLALRARAMVAAVAAAVLAMLVAWGGWFAFSAQHLLLNAVAPVLAIGFSFVVCSLLHHFSSERQQRFVKEAFSRYVSPNLVQHLVSHPGQLELGGRRQECSFIFTDLAGFTSLMEKMDPAQAVTLLNAYLDRMIAIAFSHNGTLDRIVGDAVAIMFSAPVQQEDHRARALQCALEMDAFATQYAADLQARGIAFGMTRIGVHTGEVIVGNFGGATIFDYRALGDPVNTAARLESVNKHLGTRMCVSAATLAGAPHVLARPVGELVLKGKTNALEVFEPVTPSQGEERAPLKEYKALYAAIRAQDDAKGLAAALADLAQRYPDDPLVRLHCDRLHAGERGVRITMAAK